MTYNDILALARAGYSSDQIGQLARLEQMQPAPAPAPVQPAPAPVQPAPAPAPVQPAPAPAPVQPAQQFDYNQMMAEILGIKQAVQAGNIAISQQPSAAPTADQILANIIAPKPVKKED